MSYYYFHSKIWVYYYCNKNSLMKSFVWRVNYLNNMNSLCYYMTQDCTSSLLFFAQQDNDRRYTSIVDNNIWYDMLAITLTLLAKTFRNTFSNRLLALVIIFTVFFLQTKDSSRPFCLNALIFFVVISLIAILELSPHIMVHLNLLLFFDAFAKCCVLLLILC